VGEKIRDFKKGEEKSGEKKRRKWKKEEKVQKRQNMTK